MFVAGQLTDSIPPKNIYIDWHFRAVCIHLNSSGPVSESDFFIWEALVAGPQDTPFEGGLFTAILTFPRDYPLSPPKVSVYNCICVYVARKIFEEPHIIPVRNLKFGNWLTCFFSVKDDL